MVWLKDTSVTVSMTLASTSVALVVDDMRVDNQLPVGLSEVAVRRKDVAGAGGLWVWLWLWLWLWLLLFLCHDAFNAPHSG